MEGRCNEFHLSHTLDPVLLDNLIISSLHILGELLAKEELRKGFTL